MNQSHFFNAAEELIAPVVQSGGGDKTAYFFQDQTLSYEQLFARMSKVGGLLEQRGYSAETRIAMIVHDTLDFPAIFLGAIRVGVIPIPLNTLLTTDQYRYILQDSAVAAVFVSAPLVDVVAPALRGLETVKDVFVCAATQSSGHYHSFSQVLACAPDASAAATHRDSTAFWLYSSGSTGMPKGVRHVHTSMSDTAKLYGQGVLNLNSSDVLYSAAKLFFAYGLGNALSFPLSLGAATLLHAERPTPKAVIENMQRYQPSVFFGAPTLFAAMLASDFCTPANGSSALRLCVSAGEALPADVGQRWKDKFGVDIVDGVGSTEMLHIFLSNSPEHIVYGSSGVAVEGYQVRLVDESNSDVPDGEIGELLVNGSTAAEGYWNQREKSRRTFAGEWVYTGDKYTRDADGIYTYAGRTDDMFKVSGQWVSPFEVESALITHPWVVEAAVVPAKDKEGLIKPKAFVILTDSADRDNLFSELKSHVQEQVGKWKYPRWIVPVEELPKTATGKIQRFKLRDLG